MTGVLRTAQALANRSPRDDESDEEDTAAGVAREDLMAWLSHQKGSVEYLFWMLIGITWYCVYMYAIISETKPNEAFKMEQTLVNTFITDGTDAITYEPSGSVETGMKFYNVGSTSDFWQWLEQAAVPSAFPSDDTTDYSLKYDQVTVDAEEERWRIDKQSGSPLRSSRFMRYNKLVYGLHVSQKRAKRVLCSEVRLHHMIQICYPGEELTPATLYNPDFAEAERKIKWPKNFFATGSSGPAPVLPELVEMKGGAVDKIFTPDPPRFFNDTRVQPKVDSTGGFWLQTDSQSATRDQVIKYYKELEWIDLHTTEVEVKVYTYNGNEARVASISMKFDFDRGGNVVPSYTSRSAMIGETTGPGEGYSWWAVLILFWATKTLLMEATDLYELCRAKQGSSYFSDVWNAFDVICACLAIFVMTQTAALKMAISDEMDSVNEITSQDEATKMLSNLDSNFDSRLETLRRTAFVSIIMQALRVLKYFRNQPRLSVVTKTLANSAVEMFHFFVLFLVLFMSWTLAGFFSFGHRVEAFSTIGNSVHSMFNMLLGDFDWPALDAANPTVGALFFMSYMVFIVLIALNMLLAIVMDAYSEVKAEVADDAPSLVDDFGKLILEMPFFICTMVRSTFRPLRATLSRSSVVPSGEEAEQKASAFDGPINREQTGMLVRELSDGIHSLKRIVTADDLRAMGCSKPEEIVRVVQMFAKHRAEHLGSYDENAALTKKLQTQVDDLTAKMDALLTCFPAAVAIVKELEDQKQKQKQKQHVATPSDDLVVPMSS